MADKEKGEALPRLPRPKLPSPVKVMGGGKTIVKVSGRMRFEPGAANITIRRVE